MQRPRDLMLSGPIKFPLGAESDTALGRVSPAIPATMSVLTISETVLVAARLVNNVGGQLQSVLGNRTGLRKPYLGNYMRG
jgi:hypothetical protein